jgi:hypothetical protein
VPRSIEGAIAFSLLVEALLINDDAWVDPFPFSARSLHAICGGPSGGLLTGEHRQGREWWPIVKRGMSVLEQWPRSIHEFLDDFGAASGGSEVHTECFLDRVRQAFVGAEFDAMFDDIRRELALAEYPVKPNSFYTVNRSGKSARAASTSRRQQRISRPMEAADG